MNCIQRFRAWLAKPHIAPFVPHLFDTFFEGYARKNFIQDLTAGITVGIVSIPFALALAAATGLDPARGLYTAVVAGLLCSLFGGSRFLIAGPTGALIVLIFNVIQRYGYDGLYCASIEAAFLLMLCGCLRCGRFVKYVPYPVVIGFSIGIAIALIVSQIKDFFGLDIPQPTIDVVDKIGLAAKYSHTISLYSTLISSFTLAMIFILRKFSKKIPGTVIALIIITLITSLFHLPVETIESKFGAIPRQFPLPHWPTLSFDLFRKTFPTAIGITLIAAIESLVAAVAIDSATSTKHRSNCQLIAQGIGNFGSALFGGLPATGSLARTSLSIQMQAHSPISGIIHALTILAITIICAPFVSKIPLSALSAVLVFIGWNMFDFEKIKEILKGYTGEAVIMILTLLITVFVDLSTAVQTGILASLILFLKRSSETTSGTILLEVEDEPHHEQPPSNGSWKRKLPDDIKLFEIDGPIFFAVTDLLTDVFNHFSPLPRVLIVRMRSVPFIDATGIDSLKQFAKHCHNKNVELFFAELTPPVLVSLEQSNFFKKFSKTKILSSAKQALHFSTIAIPKQVEESVLDESDSSTCLGS